MTVHFCCFFKIHVPNLVARSLVKDLATRLKVTRELNREREKFANAKQSTLSADCYGRLSLNRNLGKSRPLLLVPALFTPFI